jgi:branched-chain amino acid transport system substrate-binding protein
MVIMLAGCRQERTSQPPILPTTKQQTIKIGAVLPLTGDAAKYGQAAKKGIELALRDINDRGGINGVKVSVVYEDSQGTPKGAVSALQKLITTDKVPAVIGDLLSSNTLAMAPIANRSKVVVLSPTSSAPKITEAGDYIFRNCASDTFEGTVMAEFVYDKLKITRVAIIYINNDYGVGIRDVFKKTFSAKGGTIVAEEAFPQGATDFRNQIAKVKATKPQAVYIVGYRELGQLLKQAAELGIKSQFLSTVMFEDPEILKVAGKAAEGVIYSARAYDPDGKDEHIQKFVKAFRAKYGEIPDIFAALSYDAMKILGLAMERGGFTGDGIKKALYAIKHYPGVAGEVTFDHNGDVIQPATLKMVKDGKFVYLKK